MSNRENVPPPPTPLFQVDTEARWRPPTPHPQGYHPVAWGPEAAAATQTVHQDYTRLLQYNHHHAERRAGRPLEPVPDTSQARFMSDARGDPEWLVTQAYFLKEELEMHTARVNRVIADMFTLHRELHPTEYGHAHDHAHAHAPVHAHAQAGPSTAAQADGSMPPGVTQRFFNYHSPR